MKTHFINLRATIYCIKMETNKIAEVMLYLLKIQILFLKKMIINCEVIESFSTEITSNWSKNIVLSVVYQPPDGDIDACENYFKDSSSKAL